jgi:hypothetical protein
VRKESILVHRSIRTQSGATAQPWCQPGNRGLSVIVDHPGHEKHQTERPACWEVLLHLHPVPNTSPISQSRSIAHDHFPGNTYRHSNAIISPDPQFFVVRISLK